MTRIVLAGLVATFAMAGCTPVHYAKADLDGLVVCHPDAIEAAERYARRNFAQVIWLRCPTATLRVI